MTRAALALLVDLGGVVARDPRPRMVETMVRRYRAEPVALWTLYERLSREIDRGSISLAEFHRALVRVGGVPVPWELFRKWFMDDSLELIPGVGPALEAFQVDGRVRVVFASNTSRPVWQGLVRKFGVDRWASDAVLSYRVGSLKPERRFFEAAIRAGGAPVDSTWFLDDSEANVRAARALGVHATRIRVGRDVVLALDRIRRRASSP